MKLWIHKVASNFIMRWWFLFPFKGKGRSRYEKETWRGDEAQTGGVPKTTTGGAPETTARNPERERRDGEKEGGTGERNSHPTTGMIIKEYWL